MISSAATQVYRGVTWRNHGPFCLAPAGVILRDMRRLVRKPVTSASEQLEALLGYPWPFSGRSPKHDLSTWTVTDDWPERVPITEAEVEVFERWFADLFDELFGADR